MGEYGIDILNAMCLVNSDILEGKFLERGFLDQTQLVSRDTDPEILREESIGNYFSTFLLPAGQDSNIEVGSPLLKFPSPILKR